MIEVTFKSIVMFCPWAVAPTHVIINSVLRFFTKSCKNSVAKMQPDYTTSNHWPPLSQNCWLYQPTVAAPSYFSMAEFHPDTVRGAGRYSDQMVLNPPGDKPATRTSHLSSYRNSSTNYQTPTSYLPSHGNTFYPTRGPIRQDLLSSPADPYRILERGTANSQYSSFNSLLERNTDLATNKG